MEERMKVNLSYEGKDFCLEFTLKSIQKLDRLGFDYQTADAHIPNSLPLLFYGAFIAHQPWMKMKQTDEILDTVKNRSALFDVLFDMYIQAMASLTDEPEDNGKNATWEVG